MTTHTTQRLIRRFMKDNAIPLRMRKPRFWASETEAYYDLEKWQITLPRNARGARLREYTYHELGHALMHQFKVPRALLSRFVQVSPQLNRNKAIELMNMDVPCPKGWVSWYAMVNGSEDFCETLGAWATNDYRTTGKWTFSDYVFDINHDRLLQRKIKWVDEILLECSQQAA